MTEQKIKIVSDGTGRGTKIVDEFGIVIKMGFIQSVEWKISAEFPAGVATIVTQFLGAEIEAEGSADG
jgi:ribosome maturation protein Sdo1